MVENPYEIQKHTPGYFKQFVGEFGADTVFELHQRKQEVVLPPLKPRFIEHQSYRCTFSKCNTQTITYLLAHLKANITIWETHPSPDKIFVSIYAFKQDKELYERYYGHINERRPIYNIIESIGNKLTLVYEIIKEKVALSKIVGGDESDLKINGSKAWFWVFKNSLYTFIKVAYSKGYNSITETFSNGFPMSIYLSVSLPAQLKMDTNAKQLCLTHLMRELKSFESAFNCTWLPKLKQFFKDAISYKKQMTSEDYFKKTPKVKEF